MAALNWRERKISSGSIGLALRRSATKKATSASTPPMRGDEDRRRGALAGRLDQRVGGAGEAERGQHRAGAGRAGPLAIGSRLSGTCLVAAQATKMPIGRLIRKIARQEIAPIR